MFNALNAIVAKGVAEGVAEGVVNRDRIIRPGTICPNWLPAG